MLRAPHKTLSGTLRAAACLVGLFGVTGSGLLAGCASTQPGATGTAWLAADVMAAPLQQQVDDKAMRAEQLFVRGLTKAYLDDHEAALDLYLQALQLVPDEAAVLSAVAASKEALGDATSALFYAEQARAFAPDNAYYMHQLAQLQLRSGNVGAAMATYDDLLRRFPRDQEALEEMAQLQAMTGHSADAIATYERLIALTGDHPQLRRQILQLYFRMGDEAGTRRSLEALIHLEPNDPAPWRLLGQLYLQQNKRQEALDAFEHAYDVDPSDFETVLALSDLYRQMNRADDADLLLDRAVSVEQATITELLARAAPLYNRAGADSEAAQAATRLLERAVEIAPDNAEALHMLGDLRFQKGDYAGSAGLLERAVTQNPRDPQLWARAAAAYLESGEPREAARVADEGLLLFPGQLPLLRLAAYSLMQSYQNEEAITRFQEMLDLLDEEPSSDAVDRAEALAALGLLYARRQDQAASDAFYEKALAADPDNTLALNNYAYSLGERGVRLEDARKMAERAVSLDPLNPSYLDTLGWIFFKLGRLSEAKQWIGKAVDTGQASATVYDHYGDLHARLGDQETARRFWRQALDMAPENRTLQLKLERQQP